MKTLESIPVSHGSLSTAGSGPKHQWAWLPDTLQILSFKENILANLSEELKTKSPKNEVLLNLYIINNKANRTNLPQQYI